MFQKHFHFTFVVLSALLLSSVKAVKYSSGSTEVDVTTTLVDKNNSTEKCVTFMKNAPEKYSTACFTSLFTDGGTFMGCKIKLGDSYCEYCQACETSERKVGYTIDCDSIEPAESTYNLNPSCVALDDANIQEVLVDDTFSSTPFSFEMSQSVTDDSDMINGNNTKDEASSGSIGILNGMFVLSTSSFAVFMLTVVGL
jgi:hypothetical protein